MPVASYDTGIKIRLNDFYMMSDSVWIACGGIRDSRGLILRSEDAGQSWSIFENQLPRSIYCIDFLDSMNGFAGGDYLHLWRTTDGGKSWLFYWLGDQVPFNEEDRPAIHDFIYRNDSSWYFCGGENLGSGIIYETVNAGTDWNFDFRQHEYRTMSYFDNEHAVIAGHGSALTMDRGIGSINATGFENDFITGVAVVGESTCVGATFNGALIRGTDFGKNWETQDKANRPFGKRVNWNDVSSSGKFVVAVGIEGMMAESFDAGITWNYSIVNGSPNLLSVWVKNESVMATTDVGIILRLR